MSRCCSYHQHTRPGIAADEQQSTLQEYCASLEGAKLSMGSGLMLFPMYVVPVPQFLKMTVVKRHQVLKSEGLVVEYDPKAGAAIFVSHQWCSRHHPDPTFAKLAVLQGLLRRLASRSLQVEVDFFSAGAFQTKPSVTLRALRPLVSGFVWYDYFAVPQTDAPMAHGSQHTDETGDMGKAVFSIPAYVEACKFFVVLAPPVPHLDSPGTTIDYNTWKQRGWCRLERAARVLSPRETHILLAWKEEVLFQVGAQDYLLDAVGDGVFSVEEDRARLAPILATLMENRLQAHLQRRDLHRYRRLLSARTAILHGLPGVSPRECFAPGFKVEQSSCPAGAAGAAQAFLRLYGFSSATDRAGGSTEPILLAAAAGDCRVVEALLEGRASVNAREGADDAEYLVGPGRTPLHMACLFDAPAELLRLLVDHRADVDSRDDRGFTPLLSCSFGGCTEAATFLLRAQASVGIKDNFGSTALHMAAMAGRAQVCAQLIKARASAAPNEEGGSALMWAAAFSGGRDTIEAILTASDVDIEARWSPFWISAQGLLFGTLSIPHRLWGSRKTFSVMTYHAQGATPLMFATLTGNVSAAQALIECGADLTSRNARGWTAVELAEISGLQPRTIASLQTRAPGPPNACEAFLSLHGLDIKVVVDQPEAALRDVVFVNSTLQARPTGIVVEVDTFEFDLSPLDHKRNKAHSIGAMVEARNDAMLMVVKASLDGAN